MSGTSDDGINWTPTLGDVLDGAGRIQSDAEASVDDAVSSVTDPLARAANDIRADIGTIYDDFKSAADRAADAGDRLSWLPFVVIGALVLFALFVVLAMAFRPELFRTVVGALTPGGLA